MPTRIIIADDEAIQRMDLKDVLTKQGYLVIGEAGSMGGRSENTYSFER